MISPVDKTKILGYLNSTDISNLDMEAMFKALNKKYHKEDFIEYFIKAILDNLNKDKFPLKLTKKLIVSAISTLTLCIRNNEKLSESIITGIFSIYDLYQNLIASQSSSIDDELTKIIEELNAKASEIRGVKEEKTAKEPEDLTKMLAQLKDALREKETTLAKLEDNIESLTKSNKDKRRKIIELEESLKDSSGKIDALQQNLFAITIENTALSSSNDDLVKANNNLNNRISSLKKQMRTGEKEISEDRVNAIKTEFRRVIKELEERIEAIKKELDDERAKAAQLEEAKEAYRLKYKSRLYELDSQKKLAKRKAKIEAVILEALFTGECSAYTLIEILKKQNFDITVGELIEHILHLKRSINIEIVGLDINNPIFKITSPLIKRGSTFNFILPDNSKPLKIVSIADAHIRDFITENFIDNYKRLLEYCDKNEVDMIINLGDFCDYAYKNKGCFSKEEYERIKDLVFDSIEKIPSSPIMHLILGGNHEQETLYLGVDFLKYFTEHRNDFMFLGYDYADLTFRRKKSDRLHLLVAHPNIGIKNDTESVFRQKFRDYDFSLLGHSHRSKIYLTQSVCQVTTWGRVNRERGAMAADMYFDETGLTSLDLKPLTLKRELKPTTIINYTKPKNNN